MHADRSNRIALLLLGLLLFVGGGAGVLAAAGIFGSATAGRALADNPVSRYAGDNGRWLWPVAAVAALIVLVLVGRWLYAVLFSTDRVGMLALSMDGRTAERTTLAGPAVADAVRGEIESYRGVRRATVRVIGESERPQVAVTVYADGDSDLGTLRDRIERGALAHARQALEQPELPVRLDLELTGRQPARVV
jgi:hypothetical protein